MRHSVKDNIYNAVLESILDFEYEPNQIINERMLTERYNCSKSPVREALLSLCNDGILRNLPRYGYEIVRMTRDDVENMQQFRYLLEGGMVMKVIDTISGEQLQKLEAVDKLCYIASESVWTHWMSNTNFHLQLAGFADNPYVYQQLQKVLGKLKIAYAQLYWGKWETLATTPVTQCHLEIIEGLRTRDLDHVLCFLRRDLQNFGPYQYDIDDCFKRR